MFRDDTSTVILRDRNGCEYRPVADFKLLKDVMKMHLDGAVRNLQASANFLVRQPFGHQPHDLALPVCQHSHCVLRDYSLLPTYGLIFFFFKQKTAYEI